MNKMLHDINDDEIRIISSDKYVPVKQAHFTPEEKPPKKVNKKLLIWIIASLAVLFILLILVLFTVPGPKTNVDSGNSRQYFYDQAQAQTVPSKAIHHKDKLHSLHKGYVEKSDTLIKGVPLTILTPRNAIPYLVVGEDALNDTTAALAVQAADIRKDNGRIVGAFVYDGELLSRGQSKAGFCAILGGNLIIGVADSTPYLEQAIDNGGYFFRQYPLVVGGQVVDNKLKYSSLRKALAELNGEKVVIIGHEKQTLNEFSQTLVDLGVMNAIYLIGGHAPGFAKDKEGNRFNFGNPSRPVTPYTNYLIWD